MIRRRGQITQQPMRVRNTDQEASPPVLNKSWWRSTRRSRSQALLVDLDVGEDVGAQEFFDFGGPDGVGLGVVGQLCQLAGQVVG
jgi:hypothetical protein